MTTRHGQALQKESRRKGWIFALIVAAIATTAWTGSAVGDGRVLHDAPMTLVGPEVVAVPLAGKLQQQRSGAVEIRTADDVETALDDLSRGRTLAVVVLDLTGTTDRLLLPAQPNSNRDRQVIETAKDLAATFDRTLHVERVDAAQRRTPRWLGTAVPASFLSLLVVGIGFLLAAAISLWRGPVAATFRGGTRRFLMLVTASALIAVLARVIGFDLLNSLALGAACLGAGTVVLVFELVGGLRAMIGASVALAAAPLPLIALGDRFLLAAPWRSVADWTIVGATSSVVTSAPAVGFRVQPFLVLVGTPLLSALLQSGARLVQQRNRPRTDLPAYPTVETRVRRKVAVVAIGTIAFTVASYSAWTALAHDVPIRPNPSLASTTRCVDTGGVSSVKDLNRVAQLRGTPAMRGGDVGASAMLQDGRALWMFGDTLRSADMAGGGFVRNSMLLVTPGCLEVVLPETGGAIIPDRDSKVGYWPMSLLVSHRPGYDLVAVTAQRVRTVNAADIFGFENLGPALAVYVVPVGMTPQLISRTDVGPDRADTTRPMWGAATAEHDGMAYLYGTSRPATIEPDSGFALSLARVPVDQISDLKRWSYWTGDRWSRKAKDATTLIPSKNGVSQTLSVFEQDGRWFALSKRNEFLGKDVVVWTSPGPTGPFTAQPPVATLPSDSATGTLRYMPLAHPGLLPEPGTVVVSYSQNRTDVTEVMEDPRRYRPRFLRVTLPPR